MPVVRVDEKGNAVKELKLKNRKARIVAVVAGLTVVAGAGLFTVMPASGLFIVLLGNSMASIWNLYDC